MHSDDTRPLCRCGCGVPAPIGDHILRGTHLRWMPPEQRFWLSVDRSPDPDGCWPWIGLRQSSGHGRFGVDGSVARAHRFAWQLATGEELTPDDEIGHTCDNPPCVRNDDEGFYEVNGILLPRRGHLFRGRHADNMTDMARKGRGRGGLPPGRQAGERHPRAKLTDDHVREIRRLKGEGWSLKKIGARFGIGHYAVFRVVSGKGWTHVT